ncbi:MAG: ROK family protein [Bacteroidales bacterium]|nr:ROK family protein [Bacteroidales bacterium]
MYLLGIDIGGTYIKLGVCDKEKLVFSEKVNTNKFSDFNEFICYIDNWLTLKNIRDKIQSIGIGAPNGNYYTGTIEEAPNLKWGKKINLRESFSKHFSVPVVVHNDANAAALAEKYFGDAKNFTDFIVLTLGTGVGSGIFVNNKLLLGVNGLAGEVGHTALSIESKRKCTCGKIGCVEEYISERGIIKNYLNFNKKIKYNLTAELIFKKAEKNELSALRALQLTGNYLGILISNLINIFNPQAIFITGGIAMAHKYFLDNVLAKCNENVLPILRKTYKIIISSLSHTGYAGVLGSVVPFLYENI